MSLYTICLLASGLGCSDQYLIDNLLCYNNTYQVNNTYQAN